MPTQTFWNLPPDKREALIAIAVEEFADNDYDNASITRIVARAGIAKGSIYQYFADKKDLFLYLLNLSNQKRLEYVQSEPPPAPDLDFWELLRWQIGASVRSAIAYPLLTRLFFRAMDGQLPFRDEMTQGMKAQAIGYWQQFIERAMADGAIAPGLDPQLAAVLLNAALKEVGLYVMERVGLHAGALHETDVATFQTPEIERIFDDVVRILELGFRGFRAMEHTT